MEIDSKCPEVAAEPKGLEIKIIVPFNLSPEDIEKVAKQAALHADSLHRAYGGGGLKIDDYD